MDITAQVADVKMRDGIPFIRREVEEDRLNDVRKLATQEGLDPNFLSTLLYMIIGESCKGQLERRDGPPTAVLSDEDDTARYEELKRHLLELTNAWAPSYDGHYTDGYFATRVYTAWEHEAIQAHAGDMFLPQGALVDLGCATGRMSFLLADTISFTSVEGFDISRNMIASARSLARSCSYEANFCTHDFELEGIPCRDESVSFVVMNLGTGSDVKDFSGVLMEIRRVLIPGGRFAISFYNRDALLYRCGFMPWPTGLTAEFNTITNTLDVRSCGKAYTIYARPYGVAEVRGLFDDELRVMRADTFPSVSAILPTDVIEGKPEAETAMTEVDKLLTSSGMGAYILVLGEKKK